MRFYIIGLMMLALVTCSNYVYADLPSSFYQDFKKAQVYEARGNYQEAIYLLKKCEQLVQDNPKKLSAVYDNMAIMYSKLGDFDTSINIFKKAVQLKGVSPLLFTHLATTYGMKGDYISAIEAGIKALEANKASVNDKKIDTFTYKQLSATYRDLGFKYGYDRELLLRDLYATNKIYIGLGDAKFLDVLRGLLVLVNQLDNTSKGFSNSRVYPQETGIVEVLLKLSSSELKSVVEGELPFQLPDDGISIQEKEALLQELKTKFK